MEARSYTLKQLDAHLSQRYDPSSSLVPVSPLRLASFQHNPRALPDDPVLYEMRQGNDLVAFRTLLPDWYFDGKGRMHRFAWLSGNYVLPAYRRQGISSRLLEQAEAEWKGRLMYTNYAPASKAVYDRSGQFRLLVRREGARYYLRAASADLMKGRTALQPLLPFADRLINRVVERKLARYSPEPFGECITECFQGSGPTPGEFSSFTTKDSLFRRDGQIFSWILRYPWVSESEARNPAYPFSSHSGRFENLLYRFQLPGKDEPGWLWLLINDRKLAAPYLILPHGSYLPHMARTLLDTMIRAGCSHATIRNEGLREALIPHRHWFLSVRSMPQLIFCHKKLEGSLPRKFSLQDGDGDVVFTG